MKKAIQNVKKEIYISERLKTALAVSQMKTLTVVEAPTGYGKSVAVREYCKSVSIPVKWVNIYDSDPFHAWNSLCCSLFTNSTLVQRFSQWPFPKAGIQREHFADAFANLTEQGPMLIVMDDFQSIQSEQSSGFFEFLAKEFRDRIHIILISRKAIFKEEDLQVSAGKLHRIGVDDLRISREDFEKYLSLYDLEMEQEEMEQIYQKSEGWISMIYVSVLSYICEGRSDLSADMQNLVDKVAYATCSPQTRQFLSHLALVQDFTKELADFMNNGEDSEPMLRELLDNHTFFEYDVNTGIYHFHTIFKDCIYQHFEKLRLSERCIRYERMAEYMILVKDYHQALMWFEKAGDYEGVLHTLELFETICSKEEDKELIIRCYDHCPKGLFADYPLCLILFMWRFYNYGQKARQLECEQLFEHIMPQLKLAQEDKEQLWKSYYVFKSQSAFNDLDKMRYYIEKAVALKGTNLPKIDKDIPRTFGIPSIFHMFYQGGAGADMLRRFKEQLREYEKAGFCNYKGIEYLADAEHHYYIGDYENAEIYCQKAIRGCRASGMLCYMILALTLNAYLAYIKGDYKEAKKNLVDMRMMIIDESSENSRLAYTADMCEVFFHKHIGYPEELAEWIREKYELPEAIMEQAYPYAIMIKMTAALWDEKYIEVLSLEEEIGHMVSKYPNSLTVASIYLIFASAKMGLSHIEDAKEYIRMAVNKMGLGPVSQYAKFGDMLGTVFQELAEEDEAYKPIIEACRRYRSLTKNALEPNYESIFPMLTKRENDIALLAVDGFTNKQIAAQLFISENTVKSSMKNIFSKLGIKSRRELLRIAQMGSQF